MRESSEENSTTTAEIVKNKYTRCIRCGRKLKDNEARNLGYGKICKEKIQLVKKNHLIDLKAK